MKKRLLLIVIIPIALALSGCVSSDVDVVLDFVNIWMEERGMVYKDKEGNFKPTLKAGLVATGWSTSGDERIDAAVQAGKMMKDIEESDKLIDEANKDMRKDPPDKKGAEEKLNAAVNDRPNDWYYRNARGIFRLRTDYQLAGVKDFYKGAQSCRGNKRCLQALHRDRVNQLKHLKTEQVRDRKGSRPDCVVYIHLIQSYKYLTNATSGQESANYLKELNTHKTDWETSECK